MKTLTLNSSYTTVLPGGTQIYCFFQELIVAFAPYYRVNDQHMVGPLDQYYVDALSTYGDFSYNTFYKKLASKMKEV